MICPLSTSPVAFLFPPSLCFRHQLIQTACIFSSSSCSSSPPCICKEVPSAWLASGTSSTSSSLILLGLTKPRGMMSPSFMVPSNLYHGSWSSVVYYSRDHPISHQRAISAFSHASGYFQKLDLFLIYRRH